MNTPAVGINTRLCDLIIFNHHHGVVDITNCYVKFTNNINKKHESQTSTNKCGGPIREIDRGLVGWSTR